MTPAELFGPAHPLHGLIAEARSGRSVAERGLDLSSPRAGEHRNVDVEAVPDVAGPGTILLMLSERSHDDLSGHRLARRHSFRSVSGITRLLAHEIKNPLSGIRGAAQLLEMSADDDSRQLTRLICAETDRIRDLVDRMEVLGDAPPARKEPLNIHAVLDHVKRIATAGFAAGIRFIEAYDPSLPAVYGNRDALIQAVLNIVKNAAEAIGADTRGGTITLSTAYRPGVRIRAPGSGASASLPLVVGIEDNGPGISEAVRPYLFEPFVTTKARGSGLGLALTARVIDEHGGLIEVESQPRRTLFRIRLPMAE
jgi:two-component system nitrogen regulation sensor histidine kinase GlnL